jgi:hypothetical protein
MANCERDHAMTGRTLKSLQKDSLKKADDKTIKDLLQDSHESSRPSVGAITAWNAPLRSIISNFLVRQRRPHRPRGDIRPGRGYHSV